ncbi:MAG: tRNA guanosine(34) transglycosylase Tgt [bacterium]
MKNDMDGLSPQNPLSFVVEKRLTKPDGTLTLGRVGLLTTPHGIVHTPAFVAVGTKATVKSLTPDHVKDLGAQVALANTYHLYLQPGEKMIAKAGGLGKMMNWHGPTMTDSGGFQVFSLGVAFGKGINKFSKLPVEKSAAVPGTITSLAESGTDATEDVAARLARVDEEGVTFKSVIDGSTHRFTPERSIEIQEQIGADMIFAFDECTSPHAPKEYQQEAMARTHRWAERCLKAHKKVTANGTPQALFGIVQGGRHEDLRKESARIIGSMPFDGFGIGGSFDKEDMGAAVRWVNEFLPENKPRHLLGIGDPVDIFEAVENGCDTFDCVAPTRLGRNGTIYTKHGRVHIENAQYREDMRPIEDDCACYACQHYTRAYIAHLFRADEMLAGTLASTHNLHFIVNLVDRMRKGIEDGTFFELKREFLSTYLAEKK